MKHLLLSEWQSDLALVALPLEQDRMYYFGKGDTLESLALAFEHAASIRPENARFCGYTFRVGAGRKELKNSVRLDSIDLGVAGVSVVIHELGGALGAYSGVGDLHGFIAIKHGEATICDLTGYRVFNGQVLGGSSGTMIARKSDSCLKIQLLLGNRTLTIEENSQERKSGTMQSNKYISSGQLFNDDLIFFGTPMEKLADDKRPYLEIMKEYCSRNESYGVKVQIVENSPVAACLEPELIALF